MIGGRRSIIVAVIVAFVAFTAFKIMGLISVLGLSNIVENDLLCRNVGSDEIVGSEDVAHWRDGIVLIASGDLGTTYSYGAVEAVPGSIFAVDVDMNEHGDNVTPEFWKLKVLGDTLGRFQPHGLFISNTTQRLYVVSHADEQGGSGVHIFDIEALSEFPWLQLRHLTYITSPLFGNHALNDVTEGAVDGTDLYVTNWISFPHPLGGEVRGTALEKFKAGLGIPLQVFGVPLTEVYRCSVANQECEVAARGFLGANGITISDDRRLVFIVDPGALAVYIYRREQSGSLMFSHSIATAHPCNNIEYVPAITNESTASLWLGVMPKLHLTVDVVEAQKSRPHHGHLPDGLPRVPGGLSTVVIDSDGKGISDQPETLLYHNGPNMSMISAAIRVGRTIILGQDFTRGVGLCTEIEK